VVGGYYILPPPSPAGLYKYKGAVPCSRGGKLIIDVIYTVATQWLAKYPQYGSLKVGDINEDLSCGIDHATHQGGIYADISVPCGTAAACGDVQPAIDLAAMFINTGAMCGIIFNDPAVQSVVNAYFVENTDYSPSNPNGFMYSYTGHANHFHIRVKKPDGSCN
jgi:hypothetical protein